MIDGDENDGFSLSLNGVGGRLSKKNVPMNDPECVRCSACVQSCPTGVLTFGQIDPGTGKVLGTDPAWLAASPVQRVELKVRGA